MRVTDVIILGGGIVGASLFHRLSVQGVQCTLVDRGPFAGETTGASAGMVRVFHSDPVLARMSADTLQFVSGIDHVEFQKAGALSILPATKLTYVQKLAKSLCDFLPEAQVLEAPAARDRFPEVSFSDEEVAFYEPAAGSLNTKALVRRLVELGCNAGGEAAEDVGETEIVVEKCRVLGVRSRQSEWSGKLLVNAAGPWAEEIGQSLGVPLGTKLKAIQSNLYEWEGAPFPSLFDYTSLGYANCRHTTHRLQALVGVALSDYGSGHRVESAYSASDREKALQCISKRLPSILGAKWIESRRWFDAYSLQKRGNLGFVPGYEGLIAAYGWGGTGIKLSQGITERASDLIHSYLKRTRFVSVQTTRASLLQHPGVTT